MPRSSARRSAQGFSLLELLIAVAIILTIAAIVIPNLMRSRVHANEAGAVSNLRTIGTAQTSYQVAYPQVGYADVLGKLGDPPPNTPPSPAAAGLLSPGLACGTQPCAKGGYSFGVSGVSGTPAYRDRKSTRLNSSHIQKSRMPSSA